MRGNAVNSEANALMSSRMSPSASGNRCEDMTYLRVAWFVLCWSSTHMKLACTSSGSFPNDGRIWNGNIISSYGGSNVNAIKRKGDTVCLLTRQTSGLSKTPDRLEEFDYGVAVMIVK